MPKLLVIKDNLYFYWPMEIKFEPDRIRELLHKICADKLFTKSPRYTHFLKYLVEQALIGNDLKEQTIGIELFERNYSVDKNDGIVRVYMYNLRKKLDAYYLDSGKKDEIVFTLEKGSYNLLFNANEDINFQSKNIESSNHPNRIKINYYALIIMALVLSLISITAYYFIANKTLFCWKSLMAKHSNTICILADQVVMNKEGSEWGQLIINRDVNSAADFISYTKTHQADSLVLQDYTFFTKAIPYSVQKLTHFFTQNDANFNQVLESEFRYKDAKKNNIIYVGQHKTMSVSKELFLKNSKVFKANYSSFEQIREGENIIYRAYFGKELRAEYAMVSYFPLDNGNNALYFVSNHDIGTMATINKFTDLNFMKEFYKKLPTKEAYFNALFKVEGLNRTEVNCELVKLELISD